VALEGLKMPKIIYQLHGYDKFTDKLVYNHDIPKKHVRFTQQVVGIDPEDKKALGDYGLTIDQANEIAHRINIEIDTYHLDYFLGPVAKA
jgi:hypothetical protein